MGFANDLKARGVCAAAESLRPDTEGVRVEVRGGKRIVVDGPFAESKEMVGGFFLLDCESQGGGDRHRLRVSRDRVGHRRGARGRPLLAAPAPRLTPVPRQAGTGIAQLGATTSIHPTPKRSVTMPKRDEKKVVVSACVTWPPSARAAKRRSASASLGAVIESAMP